MRFAFLATALLFCVALGLSASESHALLEKHKAPEVGGVVFPLEIVKSGRITPCTASLIKAEEQCASVTAKHCLADRLWKSSEDFRYWWRWFATEQEYRFQSQKASIKRVSANDDLVELDLGADRHK